MEPQDLSAEASAKADEPGSEWEGEAPTEPRLGEPAAREPRESNAKGSRRTEPQMDTDEHRWALRLGARSS